MSAGTPFAQRHELPVAAGPLPDTSNLGEYLLSGSKIINVEPGVESPWTATYKVVTEHEDGTTQAYFLKTSQRGGAVMMEGEFASLQAIDHIVPGFVPRVHGWGRLQGGSTAADDAAPYFLLMDFLALGRPAEPTLTSPDPGAFCARLAVLHQHSASLTGRFGFAVPTCHGAHVQPNDWDADWSRFFGALLARFFAADIRVNGPSAEYEAAFATLQRCVVPALLGPAVLRDTGAGTGLTPRLVHGDLWIENMGVLTATGHPVVYDASAMYAHHEYELGPWRLGFSGVGEAFVDEYRQRVPPSEPADQWDDRNRLYGLKFALAHSSGWPAGSGPVRERILDDMLFLIEKYGNGQLDD